MLPNGFGISRTFVAAFCAGVVGLTGLGCALVWLAIALFRGGTR